MLTRLSRLNGLAIQAPDAEFGTVRDVYFDESTWGVRYLVVDTGRWLPGRLVLISPAAVAGIDFEERRLETYLSRSQVENSPDISNHEPVTRRHELELRDYYGWPIYWPQGAEATRTVEEWKEEAVRTEHPEDTHLQSAGDVAGYRVHCRDGELGRIDDFLFDEEEWILRYLVVSTGRWWPGREVLIPPDWIDELDWSGWTASVDHSREEIRNAPEYDPSKPVDREYERRLYEHYRRTPYWPHTR